MINPGLNDVVKDFHSSDLSTLPSSACWHLLSVLSPHAPVWLPQLQAACPQPIMTKAWWKKGMGFSSFMGEKSLFLNLYCSSTLPLRSPPLGLGPSLCTGCKGSWERECVAVRTGSPSKEELKNDHQVASKQGLPINLDVPGPLCVWQRAGPQGICGMNIVGCRRIPSSLWTWIDFFS